MSVATPTRSVPPLTGVCVPDAAPVGEAAGANVAAACASGVLRATVGPVAVLLAFTVPAPVTAAAGGLWGWDGLVHAASSAAAPVIRKPSAARRVTGGTTRSRCF